MPLDDQIEQELIKRTAIDMAAHLANPDPHTQYLQESIAPGLYSAYSSKIKFTSIGGLAVLLLNKTGAASVKGEVVTVHGATAEAVAKITVDIPSPIGVILDSDIADGESVWVVVSGIAEVYFIGDTTLGHLARGFLTSDAGYVVGRAISELYPTAPFATDKHFYEIGHIIESRTGAGLAKTILHFN